MCLIACGWKTPSKKWKEKSKFLTNNVAICFKVIVPDMAHFTSYRSDEKAEHLV